MSKIEIGRFSERLRRALGMKGVPVVSAELSPEISPVIIVQGNDPDQQFLQGVRLCVSAIGVNGVAGNPSLVRWRNPENSGVIAVFERFWFSIENSGQMNVGYAAVQADLPTASASGLRDHRWAGAPDNTTIRASRTAAGTGLNLADSLMVARLTSGRPFTYPQPVILLPGETIEAGTIGVDTEFTAVAIWSERQIPALER